MGGRVLRLVVVLAMLSSSVAVGSGNHTTGSGPEIRLRGVRFAPSAGELPDIPDDLRAGSLGREQRGYYLVQFSGPVRADWQRAVAGAGAVPLGYIPDFAYKVRMSPRIAETVSSLDGVIWVGRFDPAFALSPDLVRSGVNLYRVRIEQGADTAVAVAAVRAAGAEVVRAGAGHLVVAADGARVDALARVADVAWVENFAFFERHNEYGAGVISGSAAANASGYDGSTQIVAVADTGLGGGTTLTAHPDIPSTRITAINNWPAPAGGTCYTPTNDGAVDVDSGHGTHVATSVLGDGSATGVGTGSAPAARLVFQSVEDYIDWRGVCAVNPDGYYLLGIPDSLSDLFQQAYDAGARIHSNSWGSAVNGDYTADSVNTDNFIWGHRDMLISFSAGNAGADSNANGVIDSDSIGSPATAKNVLTVGASENDRQGDWGCDAALTYVNPDTGTSCASQSGTNTIFDYSAFGFTANPIASDLSAGNAGQMAAFSSRGPTDDGRIKPDVVAPGTWILSGYSDLYQEGYDAAVNPKNGLFQYDGWGFPRNDDYKYMGGTSMSNPITAGGAAVVRDFYSEAKSHQASAALVKATLINSAVDLADENNDGVNDNDFPIPNVHEGWGRINLAAATDASALFVDNTTGLATAATATSQYTSSGAPLKVSLVWSDFPSTETAAVNLVNDLDLVVTAPNGTVYRGNVFSGGFSATGGSADRLNNVENVYLAAPAAGTWTVAVTGFNVPSGPQPFALVVDGVTGTSTNTAPTVTISAPADPTTVTEGTAVTFTGTATDTQDGDLTAGIAWSSNLSGSLGTGGSVTATLSVGTHMVTASATDTGSLTGSDTVTVTVTPAGGTATSLHIADLDGAKTSLGNRWTSTVTISVVDNLGAPVTGATVTGTWSAGTGGTTSCVTGSTGTCSVTRNRIANRILTVTYTVTTVTHATLTYQSSANTDPDGDSTGTAITVAKP